MKIILPGYQETKKILSANSYFLSKYMPDFDIEFLNYGTFDEKLYCGKFVSLDNEQVGGARAWAKYTKKYLEKLTDRHIIFADGDFFITKMYDKEEYEKLLRDMKECKVGFMSAGDDPKRFSRVAQYAIWNREFLLEVLNSDRILTILKFESRGGRYINKKNKTETIIAWRPVVTFDPLSAISPNRAPEFVAVGEAKTEDVEFLIENEHLRRDNLIYEISRYNKPVLSWPSRIIIDRYGARRTK